MKNTLLTWVLRLADDHMIAGHRLSEWTSRGPTLEEDLALSNMALDLLGQSEALYQYAANLSEDGRTADNLAFLRSDREYSNLLLLEVPNGDFAHTILRHFYFALFMKFVWEELGRSKDTTLSAIAGKSIKENHYHLRYCAQWLIRLGKGTQDSMQRLKAAQEQLNPYLGEMFDDDEVSRQLQDTHPLPSSLRNLWQKEFTTIAQQAQLGEPDLALHQRGGRKGLHTEHLSYLLAEMQHLQRTYPGAEW